jgi:hypothetical protein
MKHVVWVDNHQQFSGKGMGMTGNDYGDMCSCKVFEVMRPLQFLHEILQLVLEILRVVLEILQLVL